MQRSATSAGRAGDRDAVASPDAVGTQGTGPGDTPAGLAGPAGHSPLTTWGLQALTVFGAFVLVLRSRTPVEVGAVLVVAVLATAVLWRVDHLHARGTVDRPLGLLFAGLFVTLAGMNLLLSARVDQEVGDRERLEASVATGREAIAELEAENEELRRRADAPPSDPPSDDRSGDPPSTSVPRSSTTTSTASPPGG